MNDNMVLDAIYQATKSGKLVWRKLEPERYGANFADKILQIEFRYPMMGDETVSGADCVQVMAGSSLMTFFSGSYGMECVQEILGFAFPNFQEHVLRIRTNQQDVFNALLSLSSEEDE